MSPSWQSSTSHRHVKTSSTWSTGPNGEKITITSGNCNAVLMSEGEYNSLLETLYLLSDPDMAADLDRTPPVRDGGLEVPGCTAIPDGQAGEDYEG